MSLVRWTWPFLSVLLVALLLAIEPRLAEIEEQEDLLERLKQDYVDKKWRLARREELRAQLREVELMLGQLVADLPDRFDREFAYARAAARRHNVRLERIAQPHERDFAFHGRLSARIEASGRFHDIAAFAADLARGPGCLLLQDLDLRRSPVGGEVALQAWLSTFRYLSEEEVAAQRKRALQKGKA